MVNVPKDIAALGFQQAELRKRMALQLMAQKIAASQRAAMAPDPAALAQAQAQQAAQQQQALLQQQAEEAEQQRRAAMLQQQGTGV